jgi:putative ABC transport system permease protein
VVVEGPSVTAVGLVLLAAAASERLLRSVVLGVDPLDPIAFAGATATMTLVGLAACLVPARRAGALDATVALRAE